MNIWPSGLPVVATEMPALHRLSHVVSLASTPDDFPRAIAAHLDAGREAGKLERQTEAGRHSWASRFEGFEDLVNQRLRCAS